MIRHGYTRRAMMQSLLGLLGGAASIGLVPIRFAPIPSCPNPRWLAPFHAKALRIDRPAPLDPQLDRTDLIRDPTDGTRQPGVPLRVRLTVYDGRPGVDPCTPLPGARVDLWGANYRGFYSDVNDPALNTLGQKFLRGYQFTDVDGAATFDTLYPGWYYSRAVHLHFRIEAPPVPGQVAQAAITFAYSGQLFFDDALSDQVYKAAPYNRRGPRHTRNTMDTLFVQAQNDADAGKNASLVLKKVEQVLDGNTGTCALCFMADFAVALVPPSG